MFRIVLMHSKTFSCGLSSFERFLYALRYSVMLWRFSEVFSWLFSCSEFFLNAMRHSLTFLRVPRRSEVLLKVLRHC